MNIHEHQAKEILKEFGAPVSNGVVVTSINEIPEKIKKLKSTQFVLKAQIHAGGRGKAGGVKLIKDVKELEKEGNAFVIRPSKYLKLKTFDRNSKRIESLYSLGYEDARDKYDKLVKWLQH